MREVHLAIVELDGAVSILKHSWAEPAQKADVVKDERRDRERDDRRAGDAAALAAHRFTPGPRTRLMDLCRIVARVLFAYVMLLVMMRVSGKRLVRHASPFDFTLSLILGDMVDDVLWAEVDASVFVVGARRADGDPRRPGPAAVPRRELAMKDLLHVAAVTAVALGVVGAAASDSRVTTPATLVSPPEAVVEQFVRKLADGRYDVALRAPGRRLAGDARADPDDERHAARTRRRIARSHGKPGAIGGDSATATAVITTERAGEVAHGIHAGPARGIVANC